MAAKETQIVVLGAGYAGLMAALRLSGKTRKTGAQILLINGTDVFVQRPRLHHVATGQDVPQTPLSEMLRGTRVHFLQGWAAGIDPGARIVTVQTAEGERKIRYDMLVYALGSSVEQDSVPGVREHAFVLDPRGANAAAAVQKQLQEGKAARLVVVGGGATGVEGAAEIKGRYPALQVTLVTRGRFAAFSGPAVEKHIRDAFQQQGISVEERCSVLAVEQGQLRCADGRRIPFDICLWAAGFRAPALAQEAGLRVNDRGQALVDPFGRVLNYPQIYAIGDAAHPVEEPGVPLRMSLLTAITRGAHAADNIAAALRGKEQKPLSFAYYGQGIALGPKDAVGFMSYPDDEAKGIILRGKAAVFVRNFFVWLLFYLLRVERRLPGFYTWLGKGRYAAAQKLRRSAPEPQSPTPV